MKACFRHFAVLASVLAYAYVAPGFAIAAAPGTAPNGAFAFLLSSSSSYARPNHNGDAMLGVMNFDGAGNVTGPYTLKFSALGDRPGQTITGAFTGTYSISDSGIGSMTMAIDALPLTLKLAIAVADGGRSLQLVATNCTIGSDGCNFFGQVRSGTAVASTIAPSLNGSYAFQLNNSPVPTTTVGVVSFDGGGNATTFFTTVFPGMDDTSGEAPQQSGTLKGTFTVNPDGTGVLTFATGDRNQELTFAFAMAGDGSQLLVLETDNSPGANVVSGIARLQ